MRSFQLLLLSVFSFVALPKAFANKDLWTEGTSSVVDVDPNVLKLNRAFTQLAEKLSPSVVSISTKSRRFEQRGQADIFRYFFGNPFGDRFHSPPEPRESQSMGSGFVINDEGYIVTNSHVIRQGGRNADEVFAKFASDAPNFDGWPAEIIGVDPTSDVAVIKLKKKPKSLKHVQLGKSANVKVGEMVVAIGNPYGHSHSVTSGIVSALGRDIDLSTRTDFIQTDASINPGNSGGPLFDIQGRVIGINTAIDARAQGIGFAIPIDLAKGVIEQLILKGKVDLGWIGIYMANLNPGLARQLGLEKPQGVLVQDVIPGGPAASSGLRSYDVIKEVDSTPVLEMNDLLKLIANKKEGEKAELKYIRDGKLRETTVEIGRRKSEAELAADRERRMEKKLDRSKGLLLEELSPTAKRMLRLDPELEGVLVRDVIRSSDAASAGVRPGDVIAEINRKAVTSVEAAERELSKAEDALLLKILRDDSTIIILVELE